jgi:hypothetical protein
MSYDHLKERYKTFFFHVKRSLTNIVTCFQCGLKSLLNQPFKANFSSTRSFWTKAWGTLCLPLLFSSYFLYFFFRIFKFFDLSITDTWVVEMRIWCIKIVKVLVLHLILCYLFLNCFNKNQGAFFVHRWEISECFISRITQNLKFIFSVSIRNIQKNSQDFKRQIKLHIYLLCPFEW